VESGYKKKKTTEFEMMEVIVSKNSASLRIHEQDIRALTERLTTCFADWR
jgi:hypothetical protein